MLPSSFLRAECAGQREEEAAEKPTPVGATQIASKRAPLTPVSRTDEERRQRKLEPTRQSHARKRAERRASGLPYK